MSRIPTAWSNSDSKPPTSWEETSKNPTVFVDNTVKNPTQFTVVDKETTDWQRTGAPIVPNVAYDSDALYDDADRAYDYQTPQANQLNTLNQTAWSDS